MRKLFLHWKTIRAQNVRGSEFQSNLPDILAVAYKGTLLSRILEMERKEPISFEDAIHLARHERTKAFDNGNIDRMIWIKRNFVEWIAGLGYHIEITGDEFEPAVISDRVS